MSPEARAEAAARLRARWADPARRAVMSARAKAQWRDPAYRSLVTIALQSRVIFTPEMDETIRRERLRGLSWRKIAARVGVDTKSLMRRVDVLGLPRRLPSDFWRGMA